jgi:hypothetical protein
VTPERVSSRVRSAQWAAALWLLLQGLPAWAELGGDSSGVQADEARMRATRTTASAGMRATVHELRLPDGSSIREFVNAQGIVYAVSWSTRMKPDLSKLLGRHEAEFVAGAAAASRAPGLKRGVSVDGDDLVVHSAGRPGAFVGRAWLKSQLPTGASADAIR